MWPTIIIIALLLLIFIIVRSRKDKLIKAVYSKIKNRFTSSKKGKVYKNVYIESPDGEITELDCVLVHRCGIFIIECIDSKGKVTGKENDPEWHQEEVKGKKKIDKRKFDNPIDMALSHRRTLNDYLRYVNIEYGSIVCFPEKTDLKGVSVNSKETLVTDLNHFNRTLKKLIKVTDGYINKESTATINEIMKKCTKVSLNTKIKYKKEKNKR